MIQWDESNPSGAHIGSIHDASDALRGLITEVDELIESLGLASADIDTSVWSSDAGDAYRDRVTRVKGQLEKLSEDLGSHNSSLDEYGAEVQRIRTAHEQNEADLTDARRRLDDARDDLDDAQAEARSNPTNVGDCATRISDARRHIRDEQSTIDELDKANGTLKSDRREIDAHYQGVLIGGLSSQFRKIGQIALDSGVRSASDLSPDTLTETLSDLSDALLDGHASEEELERFNAYLAAMSMDPQQAADYLESLGGDRLVHLLDVLDMPADARNVGYTSEALSYLRTMFSSASRLWDDATMETFSRQMLDPENRQLRSSDVAFALAYLFDNPTGAPVSPALSRHVADDIRIWEDRKGPLTVDGVPGQWTPAVAGLSLSLFDHLVLDPASAILRHVAADPDGALDWLADSEDGAARIDYWYSQREWPWGGETGAAMLWAAVQDAPGAVVGPEMDTARAEQLAIVNTQILNCWAETVLSGKTELDADAYRAIGHVLDVQLPVWLETSMMADTKDSPGAIKDSVLIDWMDIRATVSIISERTLAAMMRLLSADDDASGSVLLTVQNLKADLIASMEPGRDALYYEDILKKCARLDGAVDGAGIANGLAVAAMNDQIAATALAAAAIAAGTVAGAATANLPAGVGFAASLAVEAGTSASDTAWAGQYERELTDYWANNGSAGKKKAAAQSSLTTLAEGSIGSDAMRQDPQGMEDLMKEVIQSYDDGRNFAALAK